MACHRAALGRGCGRSIVFNVLFIYVTLVPRANLLFDDAYNDYVYGTPKKGAGGRRRPAFFFRYFGRDNGA